MSWGRKRSWEYTQTDSTASSSSLPLRQQQPSQKIRQPNAQVYYIDQTIDFLPNKHWICVMRGGFAAPHVRRIDHLVPSCRICCEEQEGFRREIRSFSILSQHLAISVDLNKLYRYLKAQNTKVLTEGNVLGALWKSVKGRTDSGVIGISYTELRHQSGSRQQVTGRHKRREVAIMAGFIFLDGPSGMV